MSEPCWKVWIHDTCHGCIVCKLAQLCPVKGPLPGTHCNMSWRAWARAYTALYTLYSYLRSDTSRSVVSTVPRSSCPVHTLPPASTHSDGRGANLHWNVCSQNCLTWRKHLNVNKAPCNKQQKLHLKQRRQLGMARYSNSSCRALVPGERNVM